jgi:hypothetical protein
MLVYLRGPFTYLTQKKKTFELIKQNPSKFAGKRWEDIVKK